MQNKQAILVIEDDSDDQEILREVFETLQVKNELFFFDDTDDAFAHLMSMTSKPFLILCDINLPKLNGIELKMKIDETDRLRRLAIPFIFLTTSDEQKTVDNAYRVTNLQGYFKKGRSLAEITTQVKCILDYWRTALHPYEK